MSKYKSIPRTFRPQTFKEVFEQDTIVKILKNAIAMDRCSHAYIFCGSRGSGKTTLARLFAKALNCQSLSKDTEPCNQCSSCREITTSSSLDVLEIDGASNRGIDDMRQLSESTVYTPSSSKYKIYIIDEVHMLTKEAFNALLKTLEEPPKNIKFLFATTEAHKVLPTILSRCQRFDLKRISGPSIVKKLKTITEKLSATIDEEALYALSEHSDGSLRDAESLLDVALCLNESHITYEHISHILGLSSQEVFFQLDEAFFKKDISFPFLISQKLYTEGKDLSIFFSQLIEHYHELLKIQLNLQGLDHKAYQNLTRLKKSASCYTQDQCLNICDFLLQQIEVFTQTPLKKSHLELILLHIIRLSNTMSIAEISEKLLNLKQELKTQESLEIKEDLDPKITASAPQQNSAKPHYQEPEKNHSENTKSQENTHLHHSSQKYETLLRFAGVEFNGIVQKNIS